MADKSTYRFVGLNGDYIFSEDDNPLYYSLSKQDTQALIQLCSYMFWSSRWTTGTPKDVIDDFVNRLIKRLSEPIDIEQPVTGGYAMATIPVGAIFHSFSPTIPENCLPLWQDYAGTSTHPDFLVIGSVNTMYVLKTQYQELYDALPDFQQSIVYNGVPTDVLNLSGVQARFLLTVNPNTLTNDAGDGDLTPKIIRDRFGAEIHQLTIDQMPEHSHKQQRWGGTTGGTPRQTFSNTGTNTQTNPDQPDTLNKGGNEPHNNMPPYFAAYTYIVAKRADDLFDGVINDDNICDYVSQCLDPQQEDPQFEDYNPADNPSVDDLDCVWAGVSRLIDWLDGELENYMNIIDEVGDIFSAVPPFTMVGSIVSFAGIFSAALTSLVRLAKTEDFKNELKCFFFCRIQARGEPYQLLPEDIIAYRAYAWERANKGSCGENFKFPEMFCPAAVVAILDFPEDAAHLAFFYMFSLYPYRSYILRFALGYSDECNDDWFLLCDCVQQKTFDVPANQASNTSSGIVLLDGVSYRLIVDGTWRRSTSSTRVNDACWASNDNWTTVIDTSLGLAMNNVLLPELPYSPTHVYIWDVIGDGSVPSFKIVDNGTYADNDGKLTVSIVRI